MRLPTVHLYITKKMIWLIRIFSDPKEARVLELRSPLQGHNWYRNKIWPITNHLKCIYLVSNSNPPSLILGLSLQLLSLS